MYIYDVQFTDSRKAIGVLWRDINEIAADWLYLSKSSIIWFHPFSFCFHEQAQWNIRINCTFWIQKCKTNLVKYNCKLYLLCLYIIQDIGKQTLIFKYEKSFRFIEFSRHNRLHNFCVKLTILTLTRSKNIFAIFKKYNAIF